MTMRIHVLTAAEAAQLPAALDAQTKRLMLDRLGMDPTEKIEATARLDAAIALKRRLGDMDKPAVVVVDGARLDQFPGLEGIEHAAEELFGLDAVPQDLRAAIEAHRAILSVTIAMASIAGEQVRGLLDSANRLLEAFGGDTPHFIRPEAIALEEAIHLVESMGAEDAPNDKQMADAVRRLDGLAPAWAKVLRAAGYAPADEGAEHVFTHPYGSHPDGSPRDVQECE